MSTFPVSKPLPVSGHPSPSLTFCRSITPLLVTLLQPYYSITQPRRRHIAQHTLHSLYCYSLLRYRPVHSVQPGHARCAPVRGAQDKPRPCRTSTIKPYLTSCFRGGRKQHNGLSSRRSCEPHEYAESHHWIREQPFRRRRGHLGLAATATNPDPVRCHGKRQHIRSNMSHILVLYDEAELPTRLGVDVNFGRLLQKLMVPNTRLSEPWKKSSHE